MAAVPPVAADAAAPYAYHVPTEILERIAEEVSDPTLKRFRLANRRCRKIADGILFSTGHFAVAGSAEARFRQFSSATLACLQHISLEVTGHNDDDMQWGLAIAAIAKDLRTVTIALVEDPLNQRNIARDPVYCATLSADLVRMAETAHQASFDLEFYGNDDSSCRSLLLFLQACPLARVGMVKLIDAVIANVAEDPDSAAVVAILENVRELQLQEVALGSDIALRLQSIPGLRLGVQQHHSVLHPPSETSLQGEVLTATLIANNRPNLTDLSIWNFPDALPVSSICFAHLTTLEIGDFDHQVASQDSFNTRDETVFSFLSRGDFPSLSTLRLHISYRHTQRLHQVLEGQALPELDTLEIRIERWDNAEEMLEDSHNGRLEEALNYMQMIGRDLTMRPEMDIYMTLERVWLGARLLMSDLFPIVGLQRVEIRVRAADIRQILRYREALKDVRLLKVLPVDERFRGGGDFPDFLLSHLLGSLDMPHLEELHIREIGSYQAPGLAALVRAGLLQMQRLYIYSQNRGSRNADWHRSGGAAYWNDLEIACRTEDIELYVNERLRTSCFTDGQVDRRRLYG